MQPNSGLSAVGHNTPNNRGRGTESGLST